MYEEAADKLNAFNNRLGELRAALNVEATRKRIEALEAQSAEDGFWDDPEAAQKIMQKASNLRSAIEAPDALAKELEDALILVELGQTEEDDTLGPEVESLTAGIERRLNRLELASLFSDPRDAKPAIVNIHPGAGGTESCDWASMLYRMVVRFCERHEFSVELMEYQEGDEAGIKSATLLIEGLNAYGNLKSEDGVHRLVRISPFDANSRRHTSFAAIQVLPEIDDDLDIEVKEEDLKMDVFRSSGPGGQKVNKTSSAVRLTHIPTGIVVACQVERSQHRNRATALQMLKAQLYDIEMRKKEEEAAALRGEQKDVAWGSQIRSYVLHPYQMVKDLRTNAETSNTDRVLDGDIDLFIEAYLRWRLEQKGAAKA